MLEEEEVNQSAASSLMNQWQMKIFVTEIFNQYKGLIRILAAHQ